MRLWMALLALLPAACGGGGSSNPTPDAPQDKQYGSFIKVTLSASDVPTTPQTWAANVDIDTDQSPLCKTPIGAAYCVVPYTDITLASTATLRAHGTRPLVLLATGSFDLEGIIDVSSKRGEAVVGAGASLAASCLNTMPATINSGGFGGSFMGKGGDGGAVDGNKGTAAPGLIMPPTKLQGGCPGGNGSTATAGATPGAGGAGGGAVAIIAGKITLNGKIDASGAGGGGGPAQKSGGGGGGAGGMIVLDALNSSAPPSVTVGSAQNIWLYANGGGGGQGGTGGTVAGSGAGDNGQDSSGPTVQAIGGRNAVRDGGNGGGGSAGLLLLTGDQALGAANNGGGGAGGGGSGFIHAPTTQGALVSPPATYP